jgi:hypothetical protein
MSSRDQRPLILNRFRRMADNRLGAVFEALYGFWKARQAAVDCMGGRRRDAYSLIFFNHMPSRSSIENDFSSSPDELLDAALQFDATGFKDFTGALESAQVVMTSHWSTERYRSSPQTEFDANFTTHQLILIVERLSSFSCQTQTVRTLCRIKGYIQSVAVPSDTGLFIPTVATFFQTD